MLVKSLRLQGFKSFADRTDLEFTPGVTCVVGPNGSGKSNVVDALAWVMGTQAARQMRGGRMEDVIFSGSPTRPEFGRAEVTLTFDNSSGAIPLDVPEVAIGRVLYRSGESRYTICGETCRLLDVVELLSDAGVGRQMHNLVGQGEIEEIIMAQPEERRVTIEEAAGVLKHRKRRERAMRRLGTVEADLVRLGDVQKELTRAIRPLARQVKGAEHCQALSSEMRRLALYKAGSAIRTRRSALESAATRVLGLQGEIAALRVRREADAGRVTALEATAAEAGGAVDAARELRDRLDRLVARFNALSQVAAERIRGLDQQLEGLATSASAATDTAAARAEARSALVGLEEESEQIAAGAEQYEGDVRAHALLRAELEALQRAAGLDDADRGAALEAQLAAARAGLERVEADCARLADRAEMLGARTGEVAKAIADTTEETQRLDAVSIPLADRIEAASSLRAQAEADVASLTERHRRRLSEAAALLARAESLEAAVSEGAGAKRARKALEDRYGALPRVRDIVSVEAGADLAVSAALSPLLDALLLPEEAVLGALEVVKRVKEAAIPLAVPTPSVGDSTREPARTAERIGALSLLEVVRATEGGHARAADTLLRRHAADVFVVRDVAQAIYLSRAEPELVFVTPEGDRCADGLLCVRSSQRAERPDPALRAVQARRDAETLDRAAAQIETELRTRQTDFERLREEEGSLVGELADVDVQLTARAEALGLLERERTAIARERASLETQVATSEAAMRDERARVADLEAQIRPATPSTGEAGRRELEARCTRLDARGEELRHVALRLEADRARVAERRRGLEIRLRELDRLEAQDARRLDHVAGERARLAGEVRGVQEMASVIGAGRKEARRRSEGAAHVLMGHENARDGALAELDEVRTTLRDLDARMQELADERHRAELEEAESRLRLEAAEEVPGRDLGARIDAAVDAQLPEDVPEDDVDERIEAIERQLRRIGPVNPLALEEYEALESRRAELESELEDVVRAKRDIVKIVRRIDEEIAQVLSDAYADVSRHFSDLFALLFPGGDGRIVMTDPGNVLETGLEIEARPRGKSPKRLSLLSGGERSLSSLAFLFAVFRARPSPFYVLDEVEAALDDVNLHRFCGLLREFRRDSQVVLVTHQKRTMETADVLYGVSLAQDGTSRVLGQRLADIDLSDAAIERETSGST